MNKLLIISFLFLISASLVFSINDTNISLNQTIIANESSYVNITLINQSIDVNASNQTTINKSITIDLRYKTGSIFDSDEDGIETITGVIDFTVEYTEFNWQVDESKLCTRWEIYKVGSNASTILCYGSQQCCNFIELNPSRTNWSDVLYLTYGLYGANHNNTASAQVIYTDYNLSPENPYAEIVYSNWSALSAKYMEGRINLLTKITRLVAERISAIQGAILKLEARLSLINDSPLASETINIYKNETLISSELTDSTGYISLDLNTATLIPGEYVFTFNFSGREQSNGQQTIRYLPSFNTTQIEILAQGEQNISINISESENKTTEMPQISALPIRKFKLYSKDWVIEKRGSITKDVTYTFSLINDTAYRVDFRVDREMLPKLRFYHDTLKLKDKDLLNKYKRLIELNLSDRIFDKKGKLDCNKINCLRIEDEIQADYNIALTKKDANELINISQLYLGYKETHFDDFTNDIIQMPSTPIEELSNKGLIISKLSHDLYEGNGSFIVHLPKPWYDLSGLSLKFGFNSTIASFKGADFSGNISFRDINSTVRYINITPTAIVNNVTIVMAGFVNLTENTTFFNVISDEKHAQMGYNGSGYVKPTQGKRTDNGISITDCGDHDFVAFKEINISATESEENIIKKFNFSFYDSGPHATLSCLNTNANAISIAFNGSTLWVINKTPNNPDPPIGVTKLIRTNFPNNPINNVQQFDLPTDTSSPSFAFVFIEDDISIIYTNSALLSIFNFSADPPRVVKNFSVGKDGEPDNANRALVQSIIYDGTSLWISGSTGNNPFNPENIRFNPNNLSDWDFRVPRTGGRLLYDGKDIYQIEGNTHIKKYFGRGFPFDLYINIGNDSTIEYTNLTENIKATSKIYLNASIFNDYISANCGTGPNCFVPIVFNSTAGEWAYSNINIIYETKPKNPAMYINGTLIWNVSGTFTGPVTIEGFDDEINNSLKSCVAVNNSCNISLTFSSDGESLLEFSLLNIQYRDYDKEPPTIYGIFVKPNPAQRNSVVNISVNASDNVNITLVTAKLETSEKNLTYNETTKLYEGTLTTSFTAGNYNITVTVTDSSNISTTSSDISTTGTSGSGCTGFCIQSGGGATGKDLTLASKDITFNLSNPSENDSILINATIFNFGNTSTSSFNVELKIDGVSKGTNSLSVSAFGSNSTQFSWNATAGNHTVTIVADSGSAVSEDNETNNEASANIYVQDITPPSILNLITQRGSLILKLNISDNVNISSVSAKVNGTNIQLTFNSTSGLWEGSSSAIGPGTYPATIAVVDSSGLATTAKSTITVYPDPIDILLPKGSIMSFPSTPSDEENTTIKVNIFNYGINQTPNFVVDLLIDGVFQENKTMSVPGNTNSTTSFTWIATYGNHTITAKIDTNNSISEFNESNNELNTTISVQDAQPPTINKVILPEIVYENAQVMIKANVTDNVNVSQVKATIGSTTITLPYNSTSQLYENSTTVPAAGLNNLTIKASNPNHLLSSAEKLLEIYGTAADLMIDLGGIKISPENITEGNNLTINATVENRGGTDANNFKVELLIDSISQKNSTLSISKASTFTVSFNWTSTYGNHNVTIRLDRDSGVAESNESNNEYNRTTFVADITPPTTIQNLASSPLTWTNQSSISISWSAATDTNGIDRYEYQLDYGTWVSIGSSTNFSLSNQADGAHIIYVRAIDIPGNIGNASNVSIYVDKTPPNTPIIKEWHSGINWTQHDTPYLSWTDPGDQGSGITRFAISVDNGAESDLGYILNYHSAQLSTGSHSFKIKSYDASNQSSNWSNTITVYIDTSLPAVPASLTSPTHLNSSKWYKENNVLFNWSVPNDDSEIYGYYYAIDRVNDTIPDSVSLWTTNTTINISEVIAPQIAANGSAETNITGLADGIWYFHIVSRDNVGNVGTNTTHYKLMIDTKPPTITNFTPANNSATGNSTPLFKVDYIDGGSGVNISAVTLTIDGIEVNATVNETTLIYTPISNLSTATHTAVINIKDNTTNINTLSWQFVVGNATLKVSNLSILNSQGNTKIFEFIIKNIGNADLRGIGWSLNTGLETINSSNQFDLSVNESIFVLNQYNYPQTGDFAVTASSTGISQDSDSITIDIEDIEASNLSVFNISGTKAIFEVIIENKLTTNLTNVSWTFDTKNGNVINSTTTSILQPNELMYVYIDYNFTTTGTFNTNATARNGSLIDSKNLTITI